MVERPARNLPAAGRNHHVMVERERKPDAFNPLKRPDLPLISPPHVVAQQEASTSFADGPQSA